MLKSTAARKARNVPAAMMMLIGRAVLSPQAPTIGETAAPIRNCDAPRRAEPEPRAFLAMKSASADELDIVNATPAISKNAPRIKIHQVSAPNKTMDKIKIAQTKLKVVPKRSIEAG